MSATAVEQFQTRHIGPSPEDAREMLNVVGAGSFSELIDEAVPARIRTTGPLRIPEALTEEEALAALRKLAHLNDPHTSMIGMGYYGTITPGVLVRNVLENPAWYTSYTPYQPEISQGRLEALLNFQTMVSDLTAMDIANASLLDEATAAAEAMVMCRRVSSHPADSFFVDTDCHPQTLSVLETRAEPLGIKLIVGDPQRDLTPAETFGVLLQYPGSSGALRDYGAVVKEVHAADGLVVFATDLLALVLLRPPGSFGADIVVGSSQRFGVPMGFGGPHAAFLASREDLRRDLPGRLVGVSVDTRGRQALRLALQTREQHIRREKATSNICTAQVLLANLAGLYACYHGPEGLHQIALRVASWTAVLAAGLRSAGADLRNDTFFDTLQVKTPRGSDEVLTAARERRINLRRVDDTTVGISVDETTRREHIEALFEVFGVDLAVAEPEGAPLGLPSTLRRDAPILTHPVFSRYRSETEMLRYLRHLADLDIALDRAMIPLGSCTMKLNATTEMVPVTWPEFSALHPFAPLEQAKGYLQLFAELESMLGELTGFAAVSLQPNAGSQGEYAGLLAIRRYYQSRGEAHRDVCLIPVSAHGTNPASAVLAGLRVVLVACDDHGNVDLNSLDEKLRQHGESVAALMITYPSTHGVFEEGIVEICDLVHRYGGQVYLDGANLNALVGLARPGDFGADVSHLNLHKTFCIPHGGGGPGVGPIGVAPHLVEFLPGNPLQSGSGPVAAAPWGSASILPISWAYLRLMGAEGLRAATEYAILAANYVAERLKDHYPVLYRGARGRVAHECIIDLRPLKAATQVSAEDVAKRLIDYGFHAPTLSFPVAGTLMIEPTESESKEELDRFCDAMIAIRGEIQQIADGEVAYDQSVLRHAPHTAEDLIVGDWDRPYSREQAAYPLPEVRVRKYWPPVSRIDAAYGDRNLMCACPPIEAYLDS